MSKINFLRLAAITLNDFMCVKYGYIVFSRLKRDWSEEEYWKSNVIGLYGPNGSGKTTIVEALKLLRNILNVNSTKIKSQWRKQLFEELPVKKYVRLGAKEAKLSYIFHCCTPEGPLRKSIRYSFSITSENPLKIESELFQVLNGEGKIICQLSAKEIYNDGLLSNCFSPSDDMSLLLQFNEAFPISKSQEARVAFNLFANNINKFLHVLYCDLEKEMQRSDLEQEMLIPLVPFTENPYFLDLKNGRIINKDNLITECKQSDLEVLSRHIFHLGNTLETLLPNTKLFIKNEKNNIDLYVEKNGISLPFANESYGTKKLLYLSCYFPILFHSPSYMLVFDELDEGIFEHLLSSILLAIEEKAIGQFIFTAHNLRPLQSLEHGSIRFAILNKEEKKNDDNKTNQYSEINCLNKRSNLRDIYYRMLECEDQIV